MNTTTVKTPDGISWHVESIQSNPANTSTSSQTQHIVLIPSGEGDCHNLTALAKLLADQSQVPTTITTFDMPGFSRTTAPKEAYAAVSPDLIAKQVATLLDTLQIPRAVFFGCSSGGCTALALCALHPQLVRTAIVHEVPLEYRPELAALREGTDIELRDRCRGLFYAWIEEQNDGKAKYKALGDEYHARLDKNFVTWMRHLVSYMEAQTKTLIEKERENVMKAPLFWTVGGSTAPGIFDLDDPVGKSLGVEVRHDVLNCKHFPAITIPEETASWILECIAKADKS